MSTREYIGKLGEDMVARYLEKQGYIITRRNYHSKYGEIDIVAEDREYILFVEVKTRKESSVISPADTVSLSKQKKIVLTAKDYLAKLRVEANYRYDIAEVVYRIDDEGEIKASLNYIRNAFNDGVIEDTPF